MAKNKQTEVVEEVETDEDETTDAVRPKDLAKELDINAKSLRGFLRDNFPRSTEEKNTSWSLTQEMIDAARAHFIPSDVDEEDDDE